MACLNKLSLPCQVACLLLVCLTGCYRGDGAGLGPTSSGPAATSPPLPLGEFGSLELEDLDGNLFVPFDEASESVIVFLFMRTDCPIGNRYGPEINELHSQFTPKGATFYYIYPDPSESAGTIRAHVKAYGYAGRAARDPQHKLVKMTGVTVTPEVVVFAAEQQMVYRGRIDNRFVDFGKTRTVTTAHDLSEVLKSAVANKAVNVPWEKAIGCPIAEL